MASSKGYLDFIMDQLSALPDVTYRAMMGEYIIYYRGKIVGGIYDDRFLVKPVKAAVAMMPDAELELPYKGAKEMILVDNVDDVNVGGVDQIILVGCGNFHAKLSGNALAFFL